MPNNHRFHALRSAICVLMLAFALAGAAQTVYIYEDEDGVTHFTDRKPVTDREVTVQRAVAEPEDMLEIRRFGPDESPVWMFRNRLHGPLAVRVRFDEADNVVSEPELPATFVLPADAERELVSVGPLEPRRSWRYRLQTASVPGRPDARHEPARAYRPPIAPGARFRIGQSFGGDYSHTEPPSYHAVDIDMPIGTPIHAAREGAVMAVARYFHGTGDSRERFGPRANFVRILHDDGSMAVYAHLDYEGVVVRPGQRVERGQLLGKSGNTGFSTGPHLHFVVQVNRDMSMVSVPFEFEGERGEAVKPRSGLLLEAGN